MDNDDNPAASEDGAIQSKRGARTFQYVRPEYDATLGAGTHG